MAKAARETKMRYGMRRRVRFVAKTASALKARGYKKNQVRRKDYTRCDDECPHRQKERYGFFRKPLGAIKAVFRQGLREDGDESGRQRPLRQELSGQVCQRISHIEGVELPRGAKKRCREDLSQHAEDAARKRSSRHS